MINKESILHLLDKELEKLAAGYIEEIEKLKHQVVHLSEKITKLSKENECLQSKLKENKAIAVDYKNKYELLLPSGISNQANEKDVYDLIDSWCVSNSIEDSAALLSALNNFLANEKKHDQAVYIIQLLEHNPGALMQDDRFIQELFTESLRRILTSKQLLLGEKERIAVIESCLKLLLTLNSTSIGAVIHDFIWRQYNDILDVTFHLKSPIMTVLFLKVCHHYDLPAQVSAALLRIFEEEWEAIDDSISEGDYIVLLWYAFLYDLDELLIEKSIESLKWFDESSPDLSLYFYLYDCINKNVIPSYVDYQNSIEIFFDGVLLSAAEKEQIMAKADIIMNPFFVEKGTSQEIKRFSKGLSVPERIEKGLDLLESYLSEKRYDSLERKLNDLHYDVHLLSKKDRNRLLSFILRLFSVKYEDITELDHLYEPAMSIIRQMSDTYDAEMFLHNNKEIIIDRVLDLNDPHLITELAAAYFQFDLMEILDSYLNKVIDQWPFIDANIDECSFFRLFWMIFNQNLEKRFLKVLDEGASFLESDLPEAKIYNVYQDPKVEPINKRAELENLKGKVKYFDEKESKRVFYSLEKRINKMIIKAGTSRIGTENSSSAIAGYANSTSFPVRKMIYVVKLPNENLDISGLTEEYIELAYFKDVFFRSRPKYIAVKVLSQNHSGKAYVTSALLQEIKSKLGHKRFIDVRSLKKKGSAVEQIEEKGFLWPSTEIKGNASSTLNENSPLNEVSDLKKTGYQITGVTREKRWLTLEKAVKQLGLKKVAFTIAQNVKLRKGQKNGERKFRYAISEWEHDLAKLKKHYYKNEFTWPSTKINRT